MLLLWLASCGGAETPAPAPTERPDPPSYAPPPAGAGAAVPSGGAVSLRPGGRIAEAKIAFTDFYFAFQEEDEAAVGAMLAEEVLVLRVQRRRQREDLVGELPRHFARLAFEPRRRELLVDPASLEVREPGAEGDRFPPGALRPGDLVVSGRVRLQPVRSGFVRDDARTLALRPTGATLLVVAIDRWPPVP